MQTTLHAIWRQEGLVVIVSACVIFKILPNPQRIHSRHSWCVMVHYALPCGILSLSDFKYVLYDIFLKNMVNAFHRTLFF